MPTILTMLNGHSKLRDEWGFKYWVTDDSGSIDLLVDTHQVCETRECAAREGLVNGVQGEMGGGTYTYETLPGSLLIFLVLDLSH